MLQRFPESCRQFSEFLHLRVIVLLLILFTLFFLLLIQEIITINVPVYMTMDVMFLRATGRGRPQRYVKYQYHYVLASPTYPYRPLYRTIKKSTPAYKVYNIRYASGMYIKLYYFSRN
jgi:hypothetical protein